MRPTLAAVLLCLAACLAAPAQAVPPPWLDRADAALLAALADRHVPDADGALGRNRAAYFHARFQLGVHRIAAAARHGRDPARAEQALRAIEYALARQEADGRFAVQVPAALGNARPRRADLASGSAFFLASAGTAVRLLEGDWLPAPLQARREALRPGLARALAALARDRALLLAADAHAPNRLLFDALAFESLGRWLGDRDALDAAAAFRGAALAQRDGDGYFIEGGGHDASYNGVATAVGYWLLAQRPDDAALAAALADAARWQAGRVLASGEIDSTGNTRVRPGGERFLGREKDVDVAHAIEGLALAAAATGDDALAAAAHRAWRHYR